jgi:hypothetical protein
MSLRMQGVGIGSDPEVFVTDAAGKIIPVIGLVGGTKAEPLDLGDGFAVQEDGVALEYNIPVCTSIAAFTQAITEGLARAKSRLPAGYNVAIKPDHEFQDEQLADPATWVSGCDPDFSAWTGQQRNGIDYIKTPYPKTRYCGGHIHVSYPRANELGPDTKTHMVRIMDMLIGIPMRWIEGASRRAEFYGSFGSFRPKKYGFEYRSASNVWMREQVLTNWAAECALYVGSLATQARRYHDALYGKDRNALHIEFTHLDKISVGMVQRWMRNVNILGLMVPMALQNKLMDLAKQESMARHKLGEVEYRAAPAVMAMRGRLGLGAGAIDNAVFEPDAHIVMPAGLREHLEEFYRDMGEEE